MASAPRRALGLALALAALAPAVAGVTALATGLDEDAEIGGLRLHMERVAWVHDSMDHGGKGAMPAAMTPDMPARGDARLSVAVTVFNPSSPARQWDPRELRLVSKEGRVSPPSISDAGIVTLGRLQTLSTRLSFDVPETEGELRLTWERGEGRATLATIRPEKHETPAPKAPPEWPPSEIDLPPGDADRGARLYAVTLACASCHGSPGTPGSATLGPDLGRIALDGASRVEGRSAGRYIYESILDPDAFIAPVCAGGRPCRQPSAMPAYGERMSREDMADLIAYLTSAVGPETLP